MSDKISVSEIISNITNGVYQIPHFQRGRVWTDYHVSMFLESIFYEIPVGTIIVWETKSSGVDLYKGSKKTNDHLLIIDGQQRITAIKDVFVEQSNDEKEWCINLAKLPQDESTINKRVKKRQLFTKHVSDRKKVRKRQESDLQFLVPLKWFEQEEAAFEARLEQEGIKIGFRKNLYREVRKMKDCKFFYVKRSDTEESAIISVYLKINGSGQRVLPEERAYAVLLESYNSALTKSQKFRHKTLSDILQELYKKLHPDSEKDRDYLSRKRESRLGLKFILRTLAQRACLQREEPITEKIFNFEVFSSVWFNALEDTDKNTILEDTIIVCEEVARLLRTQLWCDDFRYIPDAKSLVPLTQILLRYRIHSKKQLTLVERNSLAALTLRTYLEEFTQEELLLIAKRIQGEYLEKTQPTIKELVANAKKTESKRGPKRQIYSGNEALKKKIKDECSGEMRVRNRYNLLLYWLLRKNKATDFETTNSSGETIAKESGVLRKRINPSIQHIVPFSTMSTLDPDTKRSRSSIKNNLGNITYISSRQNGPNGLSDDFADLTKLSSANKKAHYFDGNDARAKRVLVAYNNVRNKSESIDRKKAEKFFEERRRLIINDYMTWINTLEAETN